MRSFGQLAAASLPGRFLAVTRALARLDGSVLPHECKPLRKQVAYLRDFVDLFAFAYPGARWEALRRAIDQGSELLGAFKDLFDQQGVAAEDAEYDADEVATRREAVLAWRDGLGDFVAYLRRPQTTLVERSRRELHPPFWREAGLVPGDGRDGLGELRRLAHAMARRARKAVRRTRKIRGLHHRRRQRAFHATRKRLRNLVRLFTYFPALGQPDLAVLAEGVKRYGELNDALLAGRLGHGQIRRRWKALRAWQRRHQLAARLADVRDLLAAPAGAG